MFVNNANAASGIKKVRHSVKPLDLSRPPTTEELMAAGQLGGQLYPTGDIEIEDKSIQNKAINLSFGRAIQEWNRHEYKKAVKMFKKHVKDYPDSPWADEALLHVGCDARYNGRYTEAEQMFSRIIENNKDKKHFGAKMLRNKARQRLGILKLLQSNFNEATSHFRKLKEESPDWRHRTYASHWIQRISRYKSNELALLSCGTQALAHVLKRDGKESEARQVLEILPTTLKGQSIQDLKSIAERYGYKVKGLKVSVKDLQTLPLPAIVQINGKNEGDRGHYWVLEKIENNELTLFDSQSGRRFHQSTDEFSREWDGNTIVFSNGEALPRVILTEKEMKQIYGGCCGAPRPESNLGDPGSGDKSDCGAPVWKVNVINMNFYVSDTPLWYDPSIGPPVRIRLSYNSQSAIAQNEPFGNKWMFNYGSYIVEDTGGNVTIFMPDGRRDVYTPDGSGGYVRPYKVFNDLTQIAANHFELSFPDGTVYIYNIPAGTSSLQPFLVEISDAYGQSLNFTYNTNVQLTTITDATGKTTTLYYNTDGLIYQVTDPFGRSASFEYDANRNLTKITDMGGYWAGFDYDSDIYLTKIENDRGIWEFYTEPADGIYNLSNDYPAPGDAMWEDYRITVRNPLGGKEEYHYTGNLFFGWYVSPRDYMDYVNFNNNNFRSNVPKIRYDYTPTYSGQRGEIGKITYPEGGYIQYGYDSNGNRTSVTDSHWHATSYTYNNMGRVTTITDAKGNVTTMTYAANGVDLLEIQNGLGTITVTYNSTHDVTSITDRLGNTTSFQYNSYGRITQSTDPLGVVTGFIYDANNRLQQITKSGSILQSFTYDSIGRIDTATDAAGLTLDYDYNDLNNITKATYPDTKFTSYTYSSCCPRLIDSITDRSGNITSYAYDAMKRIIESIDPEGRAVKYEYDANGNLAKLIDINNNVTEFEYNLDNRLVRKNYADGKYET
ncbi:MAG TPA: hypothetical protein ENH01_04575 [Nitrospirae bacterium]|nr:hypothetical protein [Nitrospirota bacterium]